MPNNGTATQVATEKKLYRIGEVSRLADLKPFVLRYWETEFPMLQPVKSSSGHRLYRQDDVDMVFRINRLLYDEGFTIAGARRFLREREGNFEAPPLRHTHTSDSPPLSSSRNMVNLLPVQWEPDGERTLGTLSYCWSSLATCNLPVSRQRLSAVWRSRQERLDSNWNCPGGTFSDSCLWFLAMRQARKEKLIENIC